MSVLISPQRVHIKVSIPACPKKALKFESPLIPSRSADGRGFSGAPTIGSGFVYK